MNDFGIDLKGKHGVFKEGIFYLPKASAKAREFICEGGSGCDPTVGTGRKLTGKWVSDGARDTINSYDLEYLLIDGAKVKQKVTGDPAPEKPAPMPEPTPETAEDKPQKKVRRKL
jgi:hypothetical protein